MASEIKSAIDVEAWIALGSSYHVVIGPYTLYTCPDKSSADSIARKLNAARSSSYHNAMNILVSDLFLSEETAKHVYHMLFEAEQPIGVQNGKPN